MIEQLALLKVEWGYGSETYNFYNKFVKIRKFQLRNAYKIIKIYNGVSDFFISIWYDISKKFRNSVKKIDYGYGYNEKQRLFCALNKKIINYRVK